MTNVGPNSGGCWYCGEDEGEMVLSAEFDTFLHIDCLRAALYEDSNDPETRIIAKEFNINNNVDL